MSITSAMEETPILVATLADTIGTSKEDAAEHLAECDDAAGYNQWGLPLGLTSMVRELVEVG